MLLEAKKTALAAVGKIDGWLTPFEAATLFDLARDATGPVVEIGSWKGRSTAALALGSMAGNQQPVYAIDSFVGVPPVDRPTAQGVRPGWSSSSPEILRANLDAAGVNGLVRIVPRSSSEAAPEIPNCDVLFVDGSHDYESVKRDLELFLPKVKLGGKVMLHDCCEADPGVVQAVDELMTAHPEQWRCRWRVDSAVIFERRNAVRHSVLLGLPGSNRRDAAWQATLGAHDMEVEPSGLGWDDMARLWAFALNRSRRGLITHFAMLHSDIVPSPGWIDLLLDELDDRKADFISATAALKDDNGLTSCGIGDVANPWQPFRRFTMHELMELPETFDISDTEHSDRYLLHNSGCWVADLRNPAWRTVDADGVLKANFAFPIRARLLPDGDFEHERESEDWYFSRMIAGLEIKTLATRRVSTIHIGQRGYRNDYAWGKLEHDEATKSKWETEAKA